MRSIMASALFILAISAQTASAADVREIGLRDGSVIVGEVVSLSDGMYTIKSENLGTVRIEESKIRTVRSRTPAASVSLTDKMMDDMEIMSVIEDLQNDEDFRKILADPEIMQAVKNNDITTLMSKPEFMKLLDKPAVRDIEGKLK